jgi:hypothetical protein
MNMPPSTSVANGQRNAPLLGAFALLLAFAFGMFATPAPAVAGGAQLLAADLGLPSPDVADTPPDPPIPVAVATAPMVRNRTPAPAVHVTECIIATPVAAFLARAPPGWIS